MLELLPAPRGTPGFDWAQRAVARRHYLRAAVDPRCRPLAYVIRIGERSVGCLLFGRPEATCCFQGGLTYGSLRHVVAGRARFDRWEILNLARVWFDPAAQAGGSLCRPGVVPGYFDRRGQFRSTLASAAISAALARVGYDYLRVFPPCFIEEPYVLRVVMSYCDTRLHRGTIYRASGFALARRNGDGIETWWTIAVAPLSSRQDAEIRAIANRSERSKRIRARREAAT